MKRVWSSPSVCVLCLRRGSRVKQSVSRIWGVDGLRWTFDAFLGHVPDCCGGLIAQMKERIYDGAWERSLDGH